MDLLANFVYGVVREAAHYIGDSAHPDEVIEPVLTELHSADRLCAPGPGDQAARNSQ